MGLILLLPMTSSEPQSKSGSPKKTGKGSLLVVRGVLSLLLGAAAPIRTQGVDWMILEPRNPAQICLKSQTRSGELLISTCKIVLKIQGLSSSSVGLNTVIL